MEEDSLKDAALVLVIQGCFLISQLGEDGKEREIHNCYPGGLLGQLQAGLFKFFGILMWNSIVLFTQTYH